MVSPFVMIKRQYLKEGIWKDDKFLYAEKRLN